MDSEARTGGNAGGACPLCEGRAAEPWLVKGDERYLACPCGFVYADMTPARYHALNEVAFTEDLEQFAAKHADPRRRRRYRRRLAGLARALGGRPGSLLEIGANTGAFLSVARERGWRGVGVEPVEACAAFARSRGLDVRTATLETAGLEPGSFDAVYSHAVLEHLTDPAAVLADAARLLRPGGVLFVDTVNASALSVERLGTGWRLVDPVLHYCLWRPGTLAVALEGAGLVVDRLVSHGVRRRPNSAPRLRGLRSIRRRASEAAAQHSRAPRPAG